MTSDILPFTPFGNIQWWHQAIQNSQICLNGFENFQKQTWRNRYDILGANGKLPLTVPVSISSGEKVKTTEVVVFNHDNWMNTHWRSIKSAYGSSPFWIYYKDELEALLDANYNNLSQFCLATINFIKEELELDQSIQTIESQPADFNDYHFEYKPSKSTFLAKSYNQVFSDRFEFQNNLSALDVLFNLGPESENYLLHCNAK